MYTFKSDHGKFAAAEDGGHMPGVIDGRAAGLMTATRDAVGPWEEFEIVPSDEPDKYAIESINGFYACCENEGKDGIIAFNREFIGPWEKFILHIQDNGQKVSFESVCRPGYFIKVWPDGRVSLDQAMFDGFPSPLPGEYETFIVDPPISSFSPVESLIRGQLRVTEAGYADDMGPINPIGIHVGDLFSKFVRNPAHSENIIRQSRDVGYSLIHFWMNLGTIGTYWNGRECGPGYTPDFWTRLSELGDLFDKYGMKGGYNLGDYKLWSGSHAEFFSQLGRELRGRDNQTAAYVFCGNEAWQTGADSPHEISDALDTFKAECPTIPITTTCPTSESKEDINEWCYGDFYSIHGWRDGEDHDRIRHIFSVMWEGDPPVRFGYQDEPTGPGDAVSVKPAHCYDGRDVDANHMCALAVQSILCNQAFNYFCSDGVKSDGDITRWAGFYEVPRIKSIIPSDIMSWPGAFHFGDSQSARRVFGPQEGQHLRFDHRISHDGRLFGLFYGDEGKNVARCHQACVISLIGFDGSIGQEVQYNPGEMIRLDFVRSQGGQPGYTAQVISGHLI